VKHGFIFAVPAKSSQFIMRTLLNFAVTFVFLGSVIAEEIELVKRDNITLKAPIVAQTSETW
jgi:hypothetical protein